MPATGITERTPLRADIQGLRAVAVLIVVASHAGLGLDGGYVGVDVFFVISGFLISQLLFREVDRTGSLSIAGFYARRARRILPAATLVTLVTLVGSLLWVSKVQAYQLVYDAVWATFFAANIRFSAKEVDYFAQNEPQSPLQHYWSLSVEEQFYLVWPLLLLACVLLWRPRGRRGNGRGLPRRGVFALLGAVTVASLGYSIVHTANDPLAAYFSTPARAWELGLGALTALAAPKMAGQLTNLARGLLCTTGLGAIAVACVSFDELTAMPGYVALLPVLGSALVLLSGAEATSPASRSRPGPALPSRLLSIRPMRAVGDWSYSLYLWHWPLLWLPRLHAGHRLGLTENLLLVAAAIALSAATYRWVETPFRSGRRMTVPMSIGLYPATVAMVVTACLVGSTWIHWSVGEYGDHPAVTLTNFGVPNEDGYPLAADRRTALVEASVIAARHGMALPSDLTPDLLNLRDDIPTVGDCEYWNDTRALCRRGAPDADHTMVVLGNSHGRMWIPALERIARRAGYATYYLVKPQCNPAPVVAAEQGTNEPWEECTEFNTWALDRVRALQPDLVVVATSPPLKTGVYVDGRRVTDDRQVADVLRAGYVDLFADLLPLTDRVVLIADVPANAEDPAICLTTGSPDLGTCMFRPQWRSHFLREQSIAAARETGVQVVDPTRWICWQRECPVVVGSTVTYRDLDHLSATYVGELAEPLGKALGLWR
jgi:peptidoglycan/LPS O-acetylase OafA/YrhL